MKAVLRLTIIGLSCVVFAACGGENSSEANNDQNKHTSNNSATNQEMCTEGQESCGDAGCVDTSSNVEHCGACDSACAGGPNTIAACGSSQCVVVCEAGFVDGDGDLGAAGGNGCELECTPTNDGVEMCDGEDNDCDGRTDEDFADLGDDCVEGLGVCEASGTYVCNAAMDGTECDATAGMPAVATETTCDGLDEDCDGTVDEGCDDDGDGWCDDSFTVEETTAECANGTQTGDCDDTNPDVYPGSLVAGCDGIDNDCDGVIDELQPVGDTSVADFTFTGIHDTSSHNFPPAVLSAPSDDGFCLAAHDRADNQLLIAHVASDGTSEEITLPVGSAKLRDVHWGGGRCGVLYHRPYGYFHLVTWAPGDNSPTFNDRIHAFEAMLSRSHQDGALYHTMTGAGAARAPSWVIVFSDDDIGYVPRYSTLPSGATTASSLSSQPLVATFTHDTPDIDVGPSPNPADDFMIVMANSHQLTVVTYDGSGTKTSHQSLSSDNDPGYRRPAINVANGEVYITLDDVDNDRWLIRKVTDQYRYADFGQLAYQPPSAREYYSSHMIAENPIDPSLLWFMDPVDEQTFQMEYSFGTGYITTEYDHPGDDPVCATPPCPDYHHEQLAIRTRGDFIELLTKHPASTEPKFHINQYSCF